MARSVTPHLMFEGSAEAAMNLYVSTFPGSRVISIARYGPEVPDFDGKVKIAVFELSGQRFNCIDSPVKHGFTFTGSISLFVECESHSEQERILGILSEGGSVQMPLDNYGFSTRFAWITDRYGVNWQLNLA